MDAVKSVTNFGIKFSLDKKGISPIEQRPTAKGINNAIYAQYDKTEKPKHIRSKFRTIIVKYNANKPYFFFKPN